MIKEQDRTCDNCSYGLDISYHKHKNDISIKCFRFPTVVIRDFHRPCGEWLEKNKELEALQKVVSGK